MNNYKNLYKLIDGLNNKIKTLESVNSNQIIPTNNTVLESYQIYHSKEVSSTKKYVGLLFDNNINKFESDENSGNKNLYSFIKLTKSNILINYSIQLELNFTPISSIICTLALGIKSKSDSKIKIIKGTKYLFDLANANIINGHLTISNTTLYLSNGGEELCMIVDFGLNCKVNHKKSLIKLLYV